MRPDFNKATVETLAKRAAYLCSNPDCRTMTVGPNETSDKATTIGEAAHIFGARPNSKRYNEKMTDIARSEITNGIWLCRNCHKLIDTDASRFTTSILYKWREIHENYVSSKLGTVSDRLIFEEHQEKTEAFDGYPQIVKRIIVDEPDGWEWRLGAELMRYLNASGLDRLEQLQKKLYVKPLNRLYLEDIPEWVQLKNDELMNISTALERVLEQLTKSFGEPGTPGDIQKIHSSCLLIKDLIEQAVIFEESVKFIKVDEDGERVVSLFEGVIAYNIFKLSEIPESLDYIVELALKRRDEKVDEPITIKKSIEIELPSRWVRNVTKEVKRIHRLLG